MLRKPAYSCLLNVSCNKGGQTVDKQMTRIILLLFLTSTLFGQDPDFQQVDYKVNGRQTNIYTDAIQHYIDSIYFVDKPTFDTLFILKNAELTANIFPKTIKNIPVCFQDTLTSFRLRKNKSMRAFNVSSDQSQGKERINILIISFVLSPDYKAKPTRSCRIRYYYNSTKKEFEFKNIACDY
jgi:hypothetical protein